MTRRSWYCLVPLLAAGVAAVLLLAATGEHHAHGRRPSRSAERGQSVALSRGTPTTTPWSASILAAHSRGPAQAGVAARQFALTYVAYLRHERRVGAIAAVSGSLRRELADHHAAAIPLHGVVEIAGVHVDRPAAGGTVGVVVQARVGSAAFGLAITMARQHRRWVAVEIPSTHGSF